MAEDKDKDKDKVKDKEKDKAAGGDDGEKTGGGLLRRAAVSVLVGVAGALADIGAHRWKDGQ